MRVLFVNTYDAAGGGGAAIAAGRLCNAVKAAGADADFFCLYPQKSGGAEGSLTVESPFRRFAHRASFYIERAALYGRYTSKLDISKWSFNILPNFIRPPSGKKYDLIHLHWIGDSFINMRSLAAFAGGVPVVWTLHDSWAFTGGCHVPYDCKKYLRNCGNCPQLKSGVEKDLSRAIFNIKQRSYGSLENMHIVSPSSWLAGCAQKSSLLAGRDIRVIANGIDGEMFMPVNKRDAREKLGIDPEKKIILFSGPAALNNVNKGFHFLIAAMKHLYGSVDDIELVVAGDREPSSAPELKYKINYAGRISDQSVMALYNAAADLLVSPSMQENLPGTIIEAFACGTPAAAFNIGGTGEIIDDKVNGCLVKPFDVGELAGAIAWVLSDGVRASKLGAAAREKFEREFTARKMCLEYMRLYEEILNLQAR